MKKEIFCKIIEIEETQGLVVKSVDDDSPEEFPSVEVTIKVNGITATQKLTFESEERRDEAFEKISEVEIKSIFDGLNNFFDSPEK